MAQGFLPVTKKELLETGVSQPDFVYVVGDAYVDHPEFRGCNHLPSAGITGHFRGNAAAAGFGGAPRTSCGLESPNWHFW